MLTVDTHFEDGYVCDLCQDEHPGNQYANVMSCASRQVVDFVNWLKAQPFYENTTIVIVGDHLTMDSDFCQDVPEDYTRGVYNTIINAPIVPVNQKNRMATTMDMFPTTMAALGAKIDGERLGLGTNHFSGKETLREKMGGNYINKELKKNDKKYNKFY